MNGELVRGTDEGRELLIRSAVGHFWQPDKVTGQSMLFAFDAAGFIDEQILVRDGGSLASGMIC
jgi:hypothetical protein